MRLSVATPPALNAPMRGALARPQSVTSRPARLFILLGCLSIVFGTLIGEVATPGQVTFGGFSLLAALAAMWLLPLSYSAFVVVAAMAVPVVAENLDAVAPLTAKFQFSATAAAVILAVLTVRSVMATHAERQRSHDRLLHFTADAAHELRSPLTLMHATLEHMLRRPRSAGDYQQQARTVLAEVDRLIRVTNALLTMAQNDAGALALDREPVELSDVVESAIGRWRAAAAEAEVAVGASCAPMDPVLCDPAMVGRVLDNLMENAIRHTRPGGTVRIEAAHDPAGGDAVVTVADSGEGIPAELQRSLFERFRSGGNGQRRISGGTGLGLAVCAVVAGAHGGSLRLARSDAAGTTMVLNLPVTRSSG